MQKLYLFFNLASLSVLAPYYIINAWMVILILIPFETTKNPVEIKMLTSMKDFFLNYPLK